MKKILFVIVFAVGFSGYAQVGVGTSNPDASAQLDVVSSNKGMLVPRIKLTGSSDMVTVANPKESLLVYNTATVGDVVPGFYYWNSLKWVSLSSGASSGSVAGTITIANGGTGAITASEALTNLGGQSLSKLTTVLGTTGDHYPSESAVKTYVDTEAIRATAAEVGLKGEIDLKVATADVTAAVATEATRATAAEAGLKAEVDLKVVTADVTAAVATETTRATTAEAGLKGEIDLKAATADVTVAVAAETTRATAAEINKENLSNKSSVVDAQANDDKYPSVKAVKTYVDAIPSFYGADGTLTGARSVNQNNADLTFTTGTAKLVVEGNLKKNGAVFSKFETITTAVYTVPNTINTVVYEGGSDATFTMPSAAANPGMDIKIFNVSGFNVGFPAGTFSAGTSNATLFTGTGAILFSDGAKWHFLLGAL